MHANHSLQQDVGSHHRTVWAGRAVHVLFCVRLLPCFMPATFCWYCIPILLFAMRPQFEPYSEMRSISSLCTVLIRQMLHNPQGNDTHIAHAVGWMGTGVFEDKGDKKVGFCFGVFFLVKNILCASSPSKEWNSVHSFLVPSYLEQSQAPFPAPASLPFFVFWILLFFFSQSQTSWGQGGMALKWKRVGLD